LLRADPRRILQAPRHLQSATYRDALKAVRTQDLHRELKTRLESLYPHWEFAVESNW
jgi:ATP-binding cassette subfamily F protein 3